MELSIREKSGLHETERQLQLKIKTLQSCLKTEKDEVKMRLYEDLNLMCLIIQNVHVLHSMHVLAKVMIQLLWTGPEAPEYHCQPCLSVQS